MMDDRQFLAELTRRIAALERLINKQPGIEEAAGGGGGTPANTVTEETAFGQAASAGAASSYSRGDHTHGTPENPVTDHEAAGDPHPGYALEANAAADLAAAIHAAASKATPVDADELALADSAASWALKKLTWANLKATLQTWLSGLYNVTRITKLYYPDGAVNVAETTFTLGTYWLQLYYGLLAAGQTIIANLVQANQLQSTVATGTAPLIIDSTTMVDNLNADQVDGADLDTDGTLSANSDAKIASQKATKTYVDSITGIGAASEGTAGIAELATQTETDAGTDDARIVTPLKLLRYGRQDNAVCDGRLTLTTGVPVTTADVTGATTIYFTPYQGNRISLYDGTRWVPHAFSEISVAVPSTVYRMFDVFAYDNAGTVTLETVDWNQSTASITNASNASPIVITSNGHGLSVGDAVGILGVGGNTAANGAWYVSAVTANTFTLADSTGNGAYTSGGTWYKLNETRATSIVLQDGRYVKNGATDRLYLGTGMTWATSGQMDDAITRRLLWNMYNQVEREIFITISNVHTYATAAWRFFGGVGTSAVRFHFVLGLTSSHRFAVHASLSKSAGSGGGGYVAFAVDTSTGFVPAIRNGNSVIIQASAGRNYTPAVGYHFMAACEFADSGDTLSSAVAYLMGAIQG